MKLPGVDPFPSEPAARARASSAWYTPPDAADALAALAPVGRVTRILEPSAGRGALIEAYARYRAKFRAPPCRVDAVELDQHTARALVLTLPGVDVGVYCCDYLAAPPPTVPYDLAIMNPPYEKGLDSAFVQKAMDESKCVVALVRLAMLESARSFERVWSRVGHGWSLTELRPFVSRPVFLAGGEASDGGKTAFMAIRLDRGLDDGMTRVRWIR